MWMFESYDEDATNNTKRTFSLLTFSKQILFDNSSRFNFTMRFFSLFCACEGTSEIRKNFGKTSKRAKKTISPNAESRFAAGKFRKEIFVLVKL